MNIAQGSQEYTAAGTYTFTVPSGVYWVSATGVGGGAGGAGTVTGGVGGSGAGGGAGESVESMQIPCTPGGTITIVVGAAGVGGKTWTAGNSSTNVHAGPEGNQAAGIAGNKGATATGLDTLIGPIKAKGGYAGLGNNTTPHGGIGGGWGATPTAFGAGTGNEGEAGNAGLSARKKNAIRHYSGSGSGGGSSTTPGKGGDFAGQAGGTPGANSGATGGGAGGGASLYGPGGNGGPATGSVMGGGDAPAVTATAYGAGGGGGGGTSNGTGGNLTSGQGADGICGYVLLTWLAVT